MGTAALYPWHTWTALGTERKRGLRSVCFFLSLNEPWPGHSLFASGVCEDLDLTKM